MKQLLRTVAVLISLLSPTFANTVPIKPNGNKDYLDACATNNLTLQLPKLDAIGKSFISSAIIKCLTIENSGIESAVDGAFDKMPNLWYLNLQGNSISPSNLFSFGNLSSVRKLILSNQMWRSDSSHTSYSPYEFYSYNQKNQAVVIVSGIYPQLRYLDLKNTGISNIRNSRENPFPELTYLDLSMNKIEIYDCTLPWAEKLTDLYLNDNKISKISLGLPNLTSLVLDNNNIETIGDNGLDLIGLPNLKNLSVANNRIESIRKAAFRDTVSLRHLNISMNSLSTIYPETLKDLHSLQVLVLDQNSFEDVPIAVPLNIMTLSMNCNRIKFLTINSLYNLPQLKTLSLTGNMIRSVHTDAFQKQKMLEKLYLNSNGLSHLPNGWYKSMKGLRYLDLSNNEFTFLESVFQSNLPPLQQLYFERNPIKYINASTFRTFSKYVTVYLDTQSNRTTAKCQPNPSYQTTTTTRRFNNYDSITDDINVDG